MSDVARRAGVSRMAASAVLMGTGAGQIRVSDKTAQRIRVAADELGYRPNPAASHLAGRRSGILAVVGHDWNNFLAQRVLVRLHEAAEENGLRILAARLNDGIASLQQLVRDVRAGWIDGLVFLAHENEVLWPQVAGLLKDARFAVIAVGDLTVSGIASVISDVASGARQSLEYLASKGRRRPLFIFEQTDTPDITTRIVTYREIAPLLGMQFGDDCILLETKDWRLENPAYYAQFDDLARRMIDRFQADCILCDTDFNAVGLLKAFRRLGIRVPEDVSVIGWGNLQFAGVFDPSITTVGHNLAELMQHVVRCLSPEASASLGSEPIRVPTTLILRESA
jgi:DNA-binding LacI/PurR family transcriptional regulator